MARNWVLMAVLALLLALALSSHSGLMPPLAVDIAYAVDGSEDATESDDEPQDTPDYACECPPGITACTCADGSAGEPSDEAPSAAGSPSKFRSL